MKIYIPVILCSDVLLCPNRPQRSRERGNWWIRTSRIFTHFPISTSPPGRRLFGHLLNRGLASLWPTRWPLQLRPSWGAGGGPAGWLCWLAMRAHSCILNVHWQRKPTIPRHNHSPNKNLKEKKMPGSGIYFIFIDTWAMQDLAKGERKLA